MTHEKIGDGAGQLLAVKAENGLLSISIGVALMAWAVQNAPEWPQEFHITDLRDFSREMVRQLQRESENGTTPVHRMLDNAANEVLEQGGDGVDEGDVETGLALAKTYLDAPAGDTDPNPAPTQLHSWFSAAALDVTAERRRQIEAEGWGNVHDDGHTNFELTKAAVAYAQRAAMTYDVRVLEEERNHIPSIWPWSRTWWKPKDRRSDLVRAAALLIAEIERLDRAEAKS